MSVDAFSSFTRTQTMGNLAKMLESLAKEKGNDFACRFFQGKLDELLDAERGYCAPENLKYATPYKKFKEYKKSNPNILDDLLCYMRINKCDAELYEELDDILRRGDTSKRVEELASTDRERISLQNTNASRIVIEKPQKQTPEDASVPPGDTQHEIEQLKARIDELERDKRRLTDELEHGKQELKQVRLEAEANHDRLISQAENLGESVREELEKLKKQIEEKETEINSLNQTIGHQENDFADRQTIITRLTNELSKLKADYEHRLDELSAERDTAKSEVARLTNELSAQKADYEHRLDELSAERDTAKSEVARLTNELSAQKADYEHRLDELSAERDAVQSELSHLHETNTQLKQRQEETSRLLEEKLSSLVKLRQENENATQKLTQMSDELVEKKENIQALESDKDKLTQTIERFQELLPSEAVKLIEEFMGTNENWHSVIYAFLVVSMHHPLEDNDFLRRFSLFDKELYDAFKKDRNLLEKVRGRFQDFLNKRLEQHQIKWDMLHTPFDENLHISDDRHGNTVLEVITALVTGSHSQRARVRTME